MAKAGSSTKVSDRPAKKARVVEPTSTKKPTRDSRESKGKAAAAAPAPAPRSILKTKPKAVAPASNKLKSAVESAPRPSVASTSKSKIAAPAAVAAPKANAKAKIATKAKAPQPQASAISSKAQGKKKSAASSKEAEPATPPPPSAFKIVTGSYEKLLYGLNGSTSLGEDGAVSWKIKPIFIFPAHVSCIKSVAASPGGKWLASGSADEIIKIWDLRRRKEVGGLMHHEGSVTQLQFPSRSHLLSASEDGSLCLFRARDWSVLRALKGHKGRVNSVAIHPSGKVALSVGKDRALRMWDLMRGKGVASTKLGKEGEIVKWTVDGSRIAVQSGSTIDIYSTSMELLYTLTHPARLHDIQFVKHEKGDGQQELLLAGAENKKLSVYIVPSDPTLPPTLFADFVGHDNRVKAFQTMKVALPEGASRKATTVVATASSDGKVRLFDLYDVPEWSEEAAKGEPVQVESVATYDSNGTRLTCLTLAEAETEHEAAPTAGKRKRSDEDEDDSEDGDVDMDGEDDSDDDEEGAEEGFGSGWEDESEEEVEQEGEEEED